MNDAWFEQLPIDPIVHVTAVGGGSVNEAFRIESTHETYFLLVQPNRTVDFYAAEIQGLKDFEKADVTAPRVIESGEIEGNAYLLLTFLDESYEGDQRALGHLVAKLHQYRLNETKFGYDLPYEGGDISFDNTWTDTWSELFIEKRMDHLRDILVSKGLFKEEDVKQYEAVREIMVDELKAHESEPSLLHGDLWSGNYMFLTNGQPALFDPAPLYGDREFDLGATKVFGGFSQDFYEAYHAAYPLDEGAELRIEFYALWLLLVHLVKFGDMYRHGVNRSMSKILESANA
ncbi:fructosamine kinase family protein [Staphylococcus massiliensis]|uniref:Fructosamine kinase n=1 Tax=Staphylococcus massiliensis S46 TaxID=1229783 RepID=K9B8G5_9STAP|nr:fructosamine kinase family protein [Staphylococcus massiliensis]EKU50045.1 hypothetical protein C273_02213 [Staphylococcus massiliensis S46]MCG3399196.1 fructosamine kinase family protein [Staphylococcus massiliensis]MCG3402248.1 fructosamine kinase family protein [Staphylococcus massiliensis]MCG3412784.1 fructosamine kinase family protein [Staphylococcus massiliensis]POA00722.1 fructosamine kinase [Staphylococcus massiliensis CCUG 55927]